MEEYYNKRIVLITNNNISYAGIAKEYITKDDLQRLVLELDQETKFSILCPVNYIKKIKVVPINEE